VYVNLLWESKSLDIEHVSMGKGLSADELFGLIFCELGKLQEAVKNLAVQIQNKLAREEKFDDEVSQLSKSFNVVDVQNVAVRELLAGENMVDVFKTCGIRSVILLIIELAITYFRCLELW